MNNIFDGYESQCKKQQKKIVSQERQSSHVACNINESLVRQYRLDNVVIPRNEQKVCDYIVFNDDKQTVYLIELKGKHVKDAIEQIQMTEERIKDSIKAYKRFYRIVFRGSATHSISKTTLLKWKKAHRKNGVYYANYAREKYEEEI
jgi:hypothetical protein